MYGRLLVACICAIGKLSDGVAIDNGIEGEPKIDCRENTIQFSFNTKNPFNGRVYVKGRANDPNCSQDFGQNTVAQGNYLISLGDCGMERFRSSTPAGMNMKITVVISFHQVFVTKVDKAFRLQCLFRPKTQMVSQALDVSMIPTTPLSNEEEVVIQCTYGIHKDSPTGPKMRYAIIGEKAYHVWACDTGGSDFGMLIHSCTASNPGASETFDILNEKGCIVDPVLLGEVTYESNQNRAYATTHVYKYSDTPSIYFQCQIHLCSKNGGDCDGVTPPDCAKKRKFVIRRKQNRRRQQRAVNQQINSEQTPEERKKTTEQIREQSENNTRYRMMRSAQTEQQLVNSSKQRQERDWPIDSQVSDNSEQSDEQANDQSTKQRIQQVLDIYDEAETEESGLNFGVVSDEITVLEEPIDYESAEDLLSELDPKHRLTPTSDISAYSESHLSSHITTVDKTHHNPPTEGNTTHHTSLHRHNSWEHAPTENYATSDPKFNSGAYDSPEKRLTVHKGFIQHLDREQLKPVEKGFIDHLREEFQQGPSSKVCLPSSVMSVMVSSTLFSFGLTTIVVILILTKVIAKVCFSTAGKRRADLNKPSTVRPPMFNPPIHARGWAPSPAAFWPQRGVKGDPNREALSAYFGTVYQ